jgi:RNA polymerase sigma factor (sigma-70 family)
MGPAQDGAWRLWSAEANSAGAVLGSRQASCVKAGQGFRLGAGQGRIASGSARRERRAYNRPRTMAAPSEDSTLILLRAAQAGDVQATNRLFERYRDRLLQVVSLLVGKRRSGLLEDEEDLVQETLLKAFQSLGSFTPQSEGALLHWLSKLAENNLRDAVRREAAQKRGEGRVRLRADLPSALLVSSVFPGGEPTPSQVAAGHELAEQVEDLLLALPERERRLFVLRRLCELSFEEIAVEMDLGSAATIRSLYSRMMARLAAQLPDEGQD